MSVPSASVNSMLFRAQTRRDTWTLGLFLARSVLPCSHAVLGGFLRVMPAGLCHPVWRGGQERGHPSDTRHFTLGWNGDYWKLSFFPPVLKQMLSYLKFVKAL